MTLRVQWSSSLSGADADAYDRFVDEAEAGHFSQARAWAPVVTAAGRRAVRYFLAREGERVVAAALVVRPLALGPVPLPVALVERGPVVADVRDVGRAAAALARAARRHGAARITAMPYFAGPEAERAEAELRRAGFGDVQTRDGAHASTLRLELGGGEDAVMAGGERRKLRWVVKNARKHGASARRGTAADFAAFERMYGAMMEAQSKDSRPRAWFDALRGLAEREPSRGALIVGEHEGRILSAVFVCRCGPIATYFAGASDLSPRPFNKVVLAVLEGMAWAREAGARVFDMGGVPLEGDDDPKRAKIAEFKFEFSKDRVRLVREHACFTLAPLADPQGGRPSTGASADADAIAGGEPDRVP